MELFLLYLWFKLDPIITAFVVSAIGLGIFSAITCIQIAWDKDFHDSRHVIPLRKNRNNSFIAAVVCAFMAICIPSAKETAVLVIASYASDLAKSPEGVKAWTLIRKTANNMLDEALKEPVKK